ncbi:ABC transporter permease [Amycolatopsis sp. CA-161197]|uniref:ABC transporter permease n=1 Tax=Amycolatopsis sp. CA-161197 TaxID=3239922 RepID=UPI003D943AAD
MTRAVLTRVIRSLTAILIVITLVFFVTRLTGDPVRAFVPENAPPEIADHYRHLFGLDAPLWQQYLLYLRGLAHGDFGTSYFDADGALHIVVRSIPATLQIAIPAFLVSTAVGLAVGILAAAHSSGHLGRIISSTAIGFAALPNFVIGIILILVLGVKLQWFPTTGNTTAASIVMPTLTMALPPAAILARVTQTSMIEALALPCVAHARAVHVSRRRQILAHALPNAARPILTIVGFDFAYLVAGSSIVEVLFGWPGIGALLVRASQQNDYAVVQCVVVLVTVSVVIVHALTDLSYRLVDPRLRSS